MPFMNQAPMQPGTLGQPQPQQAQRPVSAAPPQAMLQTPLRMPPAQGPNPMGAPGFQQMRPPQQPMQAPMQSLLQHPLQAGLGAPPQSLEQQALGGGGPGNKQQISNFMSALNGVNAGGNNAFMGAPQGQAPQQAPPLVQMPQQPFAHPGMLGGQPPMQAGLSNPGMMQPGAALGQMHMPPQSPMQAMQHPMGGQTQSPFPMGQGGGFGLNGAGVAGAGLGGGGGPPGQAHNSFLPQQGGSGQQQANGFGLGLAQAGAMAAGGQVAPGQGNSFGLGGGQVAGGQTPSPFPMGGNSFLPQQASQQQNKFGINGAAAAGAGIAASNERLKENVEDAEPSLQAFLNAIGAHNYEYKDPQDGVGTFTSPMAQELEKTKLGKQAVIDTPRGKMVNYARLGGINLAAVSVVHREQAKLAKQVQALRAAVRVAGK